MVVTWVLTVGRCRDIKVDVIVNLLTFNVIRCHKVVKRTILCRFVDDMSKTNKDFKLFWKPRIRFLLILQPQPLETAWKMCRGMLIFVDNYFFRLYAWFWQERCLNIKLNCSIHYARFYKFHVRFCHLLRLLGLLGHILCTRFYV